VSYYGNPEFAKLLLFRDFSIEHSGLTADDVRVASEEADRRGPFKGHKIDPDQPHEFPRTFVNPMEYPRGVLADELYEVMHARRDPEERRRLDERITKALCGLGTLEGPGQSRLAGLCPRPLARTEGVRGW
jgi:hypothetical protein